MDPNIRWLRREILRYLAKRLSLEFLVVTALLSITLSWAGWTASQIVPFSITAGQTFVALRVALGLTTNPMTQSAINRHIDNPTVLHRAPSEIESLGKVAVELGLLGFHPVLTARLPGQESKPLFDVLQSRDGETTAALGRNSGTITLISRLSDGRLLVSTDLLIPPDRRLIVNQVAGAGLDSLVRTHQRLLDGLKRRGLRLRSAPPTLLADLLLIEHEAYRELGPFLTPFLAFEPTWRPFQLSLRLTPASLLDRSAGACIRPPIHSGNIGHGTPASQLTGSLESNSSRRDAASPAASEGILQTV